MLVREDRLADVEAVLKARGFWGMSLAHDVQDTIETIRELRWALGTMLAVCDRHASALLELEVAAKTRDVFETERCRGIWNDTTGGAGDAT